MLRFLAGLNNSTTYAALINILIYFHIWLLLPSPYKKHQQAYLKASRADYRKPKQSCQFKRGKVTTLSFRALATDPNISFAYLITFQGDVMEPFYTTYGGSFSPHRAFHLIHWISIVIVAKMKREEYIFSRKSIVFCSYIIHKFSLVLLKEKN